MKRPSLPVTVMLRTTTRTHKAKLEHFQTLFAVVDPSGFVLRSQVHYKKCSFLVHSLSSFLSEGLGVHSCKWHFLPSFSFFSCSVAIETFFCLWVHWLCVFTLFQCWWLFIPALSEKKPQMIMINVALVPVLYFCCIQLLILTVENKCHWLWGMLVCWVVLCCKLKSEISFRIWFSKDHLYLKQVILY